MQLSVSDQRRYDLDWLRLIAIIILLFYHTGMWFNTWGWHVKNKETSTFFNYWMVWLHYWRMPLLLFISGAGTYMALGKRTVRQFTNERFRRLFIPLVFGMFVVVPPQIYYEHINSYNNYWEFYKTVFNFIPYPKGSLSWHHLWFILYLLLYSLLALPLLIYLRSARSSGFKQHIAGFFSRTLGILLAPAVFILLTQILLRPFFPEETHDLKDLGYFVYYFCFFLFGMICYSSPSVWQSIGAHRRPLLIGNLIALILFYAGYLNLRGIFILQWTPETAELIFDVVAIFTAWFTVITVIAFGQHNLNRPHPWLEYVNEGLYPFYILHQTLIIAIGYYICQLNWVITVKFFVISILTLISCILIYLVVIRTNRVGRLFFGLKAEPHTKNDKPRKEEIIKT